MSHSNPIESAKVVLSKLHNAGYRAFFVGGCVRDMIMQRPIKDIDIATNCPSTIVAILFPNHIAIGEAFGIIAVKQDDFIFEVATFRHDGSYEDGRHPTSISFGSMKSDALRRDFTINSLYYDPFQNQIYDFVHGQHDIQNKIIRAIGHPHLRFAEDKLRILRAIRFASCFNFSIEPKTEQAILREIPYLVKSVSPERIWMELKTMIKANPFGSLEYLINLKILSHIFPALQVVPTAKLRYLLPFTKNINTSLLPIVLILLPFFEDINLKDIEHSFISLKISKKDFKLISLWFHTFHQFKKIKEDKVFWSHFLATPESTLFLHLFAALQKPNERELFLEQVKFLEKSLSPFVSRIKHNKPIVSAEDLIKKGIPPGKLLGDLLKEAEIIAIERNCMDKEKILSLLQKKGFWK